MGLGTLSKAFQLFAEAITMCVDGGLHRDVGEYAIFDPIEREVRKVCLSPSLPLQAYFALLSQPILTYGLSRLLCRGRSGVCTAGISRAGRALDDRP